MKFISLILIGLLTFYFNAFSQKKYQLFQATQNSYKCYNSNAYILLEKKGDVLRIEIRYFPNFILKDEQNESNDNYRVITEINNISQLGVYDGNGFKKIKLTEIESSPWFNEHINDLSFDPNGKKLDLQLSGKDDFQSTNHIEADLILESDNKVQIEEFKFKHFRNEIFPIFKGELSNQDELYLKYFKNIFCEKRQIKESSFKVYQTAKKLYLYDEIAKKFDGEGFTEISKPKNEFAAKNDKSVFNEFADLKDEVTLGNLTFVKIGDIKLSKYNFDEKKFTLNYGYFKESKLYAIGNYDEDMFIPNWKDFESININERDAESLLSEKLNNKRDFWGLAYLVELYTPESQFMYAIDLFDNKECSGKPLYSLKNNSAFPSFCSAYFNNVGLIVDSLRNSSPFTNYLQFDFPFLKKVLPSNQVIYISENGVENKLLKLLNDSVKVYTSGVWLDYIGEFFEIGTTKLTQFGNEKINKLQHILKAFPTAKISIGCFTDKSGNKEANKKLSEKRAEHMRKELINLGFSMVQIVNILGYGSDYSLCENFSQESNFIDRRVSLKLVSK